MKNINLLGPTLWVYFFDSEDLAFWYKLIVCSRDVDETHLPISSILTIF